MLDIPLVEGAAQHTVLQRIDLGMDRLADRLVVLGDEIQQRVEHEVFAVLQQQGSCLAALADERIGFGVTVAGSDDVALAGKDVGLDELQLAVFAHRRVGDDKQRVAEGFEFRPAVFFQGVLDGQFVQVELALQIGQFLGVGFFEADPDEVPGFGGPGRTFVKGDVRDSFTRAVDCGGNNSTHGSCSLLLIEMRSETPCSLAS